MNQNGDAILCLRFANPAIATGTDMIVFYEYLEQPPYWIAHDEDGYWLVPVRVQGWHEREMFVGRVPELCRVKEPITVDLGLPLLSDVPSAKSS